MLEIFIIFIPINFLILASYKSLAKFIDLYDFPNKRKIHKIKTPLIGGVILVINFIFLLILLEFGVIDKSSIGDIFSDEYKYYIFLFSGLLIFLIGIYDDKLDINPNLKLFCLFLVVSGMQFFDNSILISELRFSFLERSVYLGKYSFLFTTFCFLLFINAANMFDGINLQSCLYYLFLLFFLILLDVQNPFLIVMIITMFIICILNSSGKIFMGDGGIFLSSFILSYFIIKYYNNESINFSDKIFILMMVPGIDMFRLFIFRLLNKKNPFKPDKLHIHHILLKRFNYVQTILIIFSLVIIPVVLSILNVSSFLIIFTFLFSYLLLTKNYLKKG